MIQEDTIRKILELGIQAPSGENSQPWRFKISGETVSLFNNPQADESLYNHRQRGSLMAHGALLENVSIAASQFGYKPQIKLFPSSGDPNFIASIGFEESKSSAHPLAPYIEKRATNRKTYDGIPLSELERKEITSLKESGVQLIFIEDREKIKVLGKAASANERILFENSSVRQFFFSHVRWTDKENEMQPNGFYVKTLELKPPQLAGFKMFRNAVLAKILRGIGMPKMIAKENAAIYESASAMVGLVLKNDDPAHLIAAGRLLERLWLTVTKLNLSLQPTTGALFLIKNMEEGGAENFSEMEQKLLMDASATMRETVGVAAGEELAILVRIGHGGEPSGRSGRFPLEAFLDESLMRDEQQLTQIATDRRMLIRHILKDLATLKGDPSFLNQYALEENIAFFEAIKSVPRYVRWLIRRAPKLDRERLLELTDLPFPRWDREMHSKLIEVESHDFPGLIAPLVNRLLGVIAEKRDGSFMGINLGSGGMEVERQIIKKLIAAKHAGQVVFIGIDRSPTARELARENLREVEPFILIHEVEKIDQTTLSQIIKKEKQRHVIVLAQNDIFSLPEQFPQRSFDVIYHTLFKHHLNSSQKEKLDSLIAPLSKKMLEYDGYKSWPVVIPQTITGWHYPAFLNAELFSNFRFLEKKELMISSRDKKLSFYPRVGMYLLE